MREARGSMEKITSFTIDHIKLQPGLYVSRKDQVGAETVTTFDLRLTSPNDEPVMNTAEVHTIEHLAATYLRNQPQWKDRVLYFGPMGCRTGFYLIVRQEPDESADELNRAVLAALREALAGIAAHTGKVPGAHRRECGNYRCLSLSAAKEEAARYLEALDSRPQSFEYEKQEKGI